MSDRATAVIIPLIELSRRESRAIQQLESAGMPGYWGLCEGISPHSPQHPAFAHAGCWQDAGLSQRAAAAAARAYVRAWQSRKV